MTNLVDDPRFKTNHMQVNNHKSLKLIIENWTSTRNVSEIVTIMMRNGVPACPIYNIGDIVEDEHISKHREMIVEINQSNLGSIKLLGNPVKMSETRPCPIGPAPDLGKDTEDVLKALLDLSNAEISELRLKGVI